METIRPDGDPDPDDIPENRKTTIFPIIEEKLVVDKRTLDKGGYRIVKTVVHVEEVVDEPLNLHEADVERRPIGRILPSMEPPPVRHEGDTIVVSIVEEVLVVEKRLMLREELRIRRTDSVVRKPMIFALRKENIEIERLEAGE